MTDGSREMRRVRAFGRKRTQCHMWHPHERQDKHAPPLAFITPVGEFGEKSDEWDQRDTHPTERSWGAVARRGLEGE